ncbi:SDR family NAD(P)-dependent oxidoreductase [Pseudactinotalea suaedae]|uniref:SDR family NAD(P)-dependent oxidoreductase n=1 Tax=Pseudactinotalea suaedae TaxID=1524924 RepID=UPI0013914888|nr:SDR family oxidoreductase [Pseudactinotalea suaedae]
MTLSGAVTTSRRLDGKVVLVTGGGTGLGSAVALAVARAGGDVALTFHTSEQGARETAAAVRELGVGCQTRPLDVRDQQDVVGAVAWAVETFGHLDGLVNNAGVMPEHPFLEITAEQWDDVLRTDLTGAFYASQAAIPVMLERGGGSIVNIASRLGQVGWPGVAHYASAKAGTIALVKSISREFGQQGIRANAVSPGVMNTDMGRTVMEGETGRKRMSELPLGRFAEPEEVADAVVFLLSDDSALFLGQTLCPNAGGLMP